MSSIYITEPATKGKVILKTTLGDIDVELWPKEAPKATRNFVQLCMEGYYDNTIFHRIIKNFIMQGGDPTGSGFAGESIYGESFPDEFHSRLRFSHRGIVAMAGTHSTEQNNGSQFFITFDKTPELQAKHTIFGKITGDTIFNLLKANDFEVDENDKPLFPPKIISVDVVNNPFDDIIPRVTKKSDSSKEQKGKPTKNLNLLSFGEEAEAEEEELNSTSTNITMKSTYAFSENAEERESARQVELKKQQEKLAKASSSSSSSTDSKEAAAAKLKQSIAEGSKDEDFASRMREKVRQSKKKFHMEDKEAEDESSISSSKDGGPKDRMQELAEQQNLLKKEIMEMKKKKEKGDKEEKVVKMSLLDEQRAKYIEKYQAKKRKRGQPVNEALILGKLEGFKKSLKSNVDIPDDKEDQEDASDTKEEKNWDPLEILKDVDNLEEGNDPGWLSHSLKFEKLTKSKDPMLRNEDDSYTTYDPLKQKDKDHVSHHKKRLSSQKKLDKW